MYCSSFDPIVKGLERNRFIICVLDWGLERICLTDLIFLVLGGNVFPSRLTWGLERSLLTSIFDCIFNSVGIILSSCDAYAVYHRGHEMSQCVSVLLISFLHVGWGLERSFSACFPDDSYAVYTKGLRYGRMVKALACRVKGPGSNLTWEKFRKKFRKKKKKKKKKKKRPAILCLHDGSPDDGSAPQLVKGWGVCYHVYMISAHKRTCVDRRNMPNHHTSICSYHV